MFRGSYNPVPATGGETRSGMTSGPGFPDMVRRQWRLLVAVVALSLVGGAVFLAVTPKRYTAIARLSVERLNANLVAQPRDESRDPLQDKFLSTQAEIIRATPILAMVAGMPGADQMRMFDGVSSRVGYLRSNLQVEVGKKDDLITLSLESPYPDEAVEVVHSIVEAYRAYQSKQRRDAAGELYALLQQQREQHEAKLQERNNALLAFRKENQGFESDADRGGIVMQRLAALGEALTQARLETINSKTKFEDAARAAGLDPVQLAQFTPKGQAGLSESGEQEIRSQIIQLRGTLEDYRLNYLPGHPVIRQLEARLQQLQQTHAMAALARWRSAESREAELTESYELQQSVAVRHTAAASVYQQIQNDIKRLESQLDTIADRIRELSLSVSAGALSIDVIDTPSTDFVPPAPRPARTMLIALATGVALGLLVAFTREWVDPRLRSVEEAESLLGGPLLGAVPAASGRTSPQVLAWISHADIASPLADAFRTVRTSLDLGTHGARVIAVVSPGVGEGRSTLVSNLALIYAHSGKRVLLVDADFHRPVLHSLFDLPPGDGLAAVLAGNVDLNDAVRDTAVENLKLLSSGSTRLGSQLLNTPAFESLLDRLGREFDLVLLDTPAIQVASDARVVAAHSQATVLLVRLGKTNRFHAVRARDGLWNVAANVVGVVVNGSEAAATLPISPMFRRTDGTNGASCPDSRHPLVAETGGSD